MIKISAKHQKILGLFLRHDFLSSSDVHGRLSKEGEETSLVTVKRELSRMVASGLLTAFGRGRSRAYGISILGRVFSEEDANSYCAREAPGHHKKEASMTRNRREAFTFVHENKKKFRALTRANLEQLHGILVKDLSVSTGLRQKPVGVTGSTYRPLDNVHQIKEAVESLATAAARAETPYEKALLVLLGVSYIQPFDDGNKRTARIMANAILLAHDCTPLSYRSVEEKDYREATLVFYEVNSIAPFKNIFIEQYVFAAKNYAVK